MPTKKTYPSDFLDGKRTVGMLPENQGTHQFTQGWAEAKVQCMPPVTKFGSRNLSELSQESYVTDFGIFLTAMASNWFD